MFQARFCAAFSVWVITNASFAQVTFLTEFPIPEADFARGVHLDRDVVIRHNSIESSLDEVVGFDLDGNELWTAVEPYETTGGGFGNFATASDGVYVITDWTYYELPASGNRLGRAYGYDSSTGNLLYELEAVVGNYGRNVAAADGRVFVGDANAKVTRSYDIKTGELIDEFDFQSFSGLLAFGDDLIDYVRVRDRNSGELTLELSEGFEPAPGGTSVAANSNRIFLGQPGANRVYSYDHAGNLQGIIEQDDPNDDGLLNFNFGFPIVATETFLAVPRLADQAHRDDSIQGEVFLYDPQTLAPLGSIAGTKPGSALFGRYLDAEGDLLLIGERDRGGSAFLYQIQVPEPSSISMLASIFLAMLVYRDARGRERELA